MVWCNTKHTLLLSFGYCWAMRIIIIKIFSFFQLFPNFAYGEVNITSKKSAGLSSLSLSTRHGTHNIIFYKSIFVTNILHVTDDDLVRDLKNSLMKRKQQWERTSSSNSITSQLNIAKKMKLLKKVENPTVSSIQKSVMEINEPSCSTVNVISNHTIRCPKFSTIDQGICPKIKSPIVTTQNVNTNIASAEPQTLTSQKENPTENFDETKTKNVQEPATFEIPTPISKVVS